MANKKTLDEQFVRAIQHNPGDPAARRVYADWLEEQSDPRAEFIRVQEEMREVPIHSDRYWTLKARRNELRPTLKDSWVGRLGYGPHYEPIFRDLPDGSKGRWRLLREFMERWYEIPLGDVGGQLARIDQVETEVGYALPPSIREWIAFLGDLTDGNAYEFVFRDCVSLNEIKAHPAFSLMIQGEGDYHWAVPKQHLSEDDSPVEGYNLDYEGNESRFVHDHRWASRVTTWAFLHIHSYMGMFCGAEKGYFQISLADPAGAQAELIEAFPVVARLDYNTTIFEAENILAVLSRDHWGSGATRLTVHVRKKLTAKAIPACLREYARQSRRTGGIFNPQ